MKMNMKSILIIDDEREICESIEMILEYEDYDVDYSTDSDDGLRKLKSNFYDVLILDIQMPGKTGFDILDIIKSENIDLTVVIISAFSSIENAVTATKKGAYDFIEKPIDRDKLLITVRNASEHRSLRKKNKELKESLEGDSEILGESEGMLKVKETIKMVAAAEARVLITGENGTGKELVAKAIHKMSSRADNEMIEVNCAAIPGELIESELFGHEKGSFTGAHQKRIGKFEEANGSSLFLDEIGDMSLQAQAKVLKAIEEQKIQRVGSGKSIEVDVRVIAATNKDLAEEIDNGNFREDLYHRLNVIPIHVPPLRERKDDIEILVKKFLEEYAEKNRIQRKSIDDKAVNLLKNYNWPGNVRELKNMIERILILSPGDEIKENNVMMLLPGKKKIEGELLDLSDNFQEFKEASERAFVLKKLNENNWNISKTAEVIDIQRSHLYSKIKKYNLEKGKE